MQEGAVIGAIAGLVIGWLIAAGKSKFTYYGGAYGKFEGMGCFANIVLYVVLASIGAVIGIIVSSF